MIEVGMHGANHFSLKGDSLDDESGISIHGKKISATHETYTWEVVVSLAGRAVETSTVLREDGIDGVLRQVRLSLENMDVEEGVDTAEIRQYCERLQQDWENGRFRFSGREDAGPSEQDVADVLSEPEVRWKLIAHLKEQIDADPLAYANDAKIMACIDKVAADLKYAKAMDEVDHGNHHASHAPCPCYDCQVRRGERRP